MTAFYFRHMRLADFIIRCYFFLRFIAGSNMRNFSVGQPAIPMVKTIMMAILFGCIGVIFSFCSYAQMRWINAWRIITRMHNYHSIGNFFPCEKFIGISMRSYRIFPWQQKNPITVIVFCPNPKPTSICFLYFGFKNIIWPKLSKLIQRSVIARSVVTWSAKFSSNGRSSITNNANNCFFGLIGHFNPLNVTSNIYHINGGG